MPLPVNLTGKIRTPPLLTDDKPINPPVSPSSPSISKERIIERRVQEEKILDEVRKGLEVEISKEVTEAGGKEIKETIELPEKVAKQTGAFEVGPGVAIPSQPTVKLPLDIQKIAQVKKKNKVVDSVLWLAWWCWRQIGIAKFKALKLVKVKR